jgi:hypothetical protein
MRNDVFMSAEAGEGNFNAGTGCFLRVKKNKAMTVREEHNGIRDRRMTDE